MEDKRILALIGADAPSSIADSLLSLGFSVLRLPHDERLAAPVRSHADMLMLPLCNKVFTSPEYLALAKSVFEALEGFGYEVIPAPADIRNEYPFDVAFDALVVNKHIICRRDILPNTIVIESGEMGYSLLNSKQGYAKCSAAVVGDNAVITADKSIASAAKSAGAEVLEIKPDRSIRLEGYDYGFIGGASGCIDDTSYFAGNISLHSDCERIEEFCRERAKAIVSLSNEPLCDIGGIFFFPRVI